MAQRLFGSMDNHIDRFAKIDKIQEKCQFCQKRLLITAIIHWYLAKSLTKLLKNIFLSNLAMSYHSGTTSQIINTPYNREGDRRINQYVPFMRTVPFHNAVFSFLSASLPVLLLSPAVLRVRKSYLRYPLRLPGYWFPSSWLR